MSNISKKDEIRILTAYRTADDVCRSQAIQQFFPLAISQVIKVLERNPFFNYMRADLEQLARIELITVFDTYNEEKEARLTTYACTCIYRRLRDEIKKEKFFQGQHEFSDDQVSLEEDHTYSKQVPMCDSMSALRKLGDMVEHKVLTTRQFQVCRLVIESERLNKAEVARKLKISRQRVGELFRDMSTNLVLKSKLQKSVA
jgi:hypothetical protein